MLENKQFHENEIWKEIKGYEGLYAVSNKGRVMNIMSGKVLKPGINGNGYENVVLCKNGKHKNYKVHRLVAQAFIPNKLNLPEVNHIDECKTNNDVSNLEWVSKSDNIRHSIHKCSCRINQLTLDGEFVKVWNSSMDIERELAFDKGSIIHCCKGRQRSAYGYIWRYVNPDSQRVINRPVAALTKDGELVAEYRSAAEAARGLKIRPNQICLCLKGTYKSAHGLRFIYID